MTATNRHLSTLAARCRAGRRRGRGRRRRAPRSCGTGRRRRRPARAARRARRAPLAAASRAAAASATSSVPQRSKRDLALERGRELLARLADQVGPGDAREERLEAGDAALLGLAAQDPEDVALEGGERGGGAVGVGGLAVVDEERAPEPADLLQAMRQAGECLQRGRHLARRHAEAHSRRRWRPARSGCCARRAASRCRRGRRRRRAGRSRARGRRARCRRRTTRAPRARAPRRDRPSRGWQAAGARRCRGTSRRPRR